MQYSRESFIGTSRDMDTAIQLYRVRKGNYTGAKQEMESVVYSDGLELEDPVYSDEVDTDDPMDAITIPGFDKNIGCNFMQQMMFIMKLNHPQMKDDIISKLTGELPVMLEYLLTDRCTEALPRPRPP